MGKQCVRIWESPNTHLYVTSIFSNKRLNFSTDPQ
jgi:hypothetical protein